MREAVSFIAARGVFNIALARTRLPADKRRKKEALMENVFALTTVEKRKGVERAKTTGHQPGLRKGWTLAPVRCPPDMLARPYGFYTTRNGKRGRERGRIKIW